MFFFSHSRTAFKYSLKSLKEKEKNEVLIPDLNCDTITHCKNDTDHKFIFYRVDRNFEPLWEDIKLKINSKTVALMVVNYFGIPNSIIKAKEFCISNKILLIEDNSHGYKGSLENIELGNFGDFGFSSPRKHLPMKYGGILHTKIPFDLNSFNLPKNNNEIKNKINFHLSYNYPNIKSILRKLFFKQPNYFPDKPEAIIDDFILDDYSINVIKKTNWNILKSYKYENYLEWENFAKKKSLAPAISHNFKDINPWCFPIITNSKTDLTSWLDWAWKKNIIAFTWPTLPREIHEKSDAFQISKSLLCFSTYFSPKNLY